MLLNKKTALSISSFILLSLVSACSSNVVPNAVALNGDTSFANSNLVNRISENVTQSKQDPSHFFIDAGKGQKTGASITVKLNLGSSFNTKAAGDNIDGTPAKIVSDISKLNVVLMTSTTGTIPTSITNGNLVVRGDVTRSTVSGITGWSANTTPGVATVTFNNIPANTSGDSYYVAAAAFEGTTNITRLLPATTPDATNINDTSTSALGRFYVSSTGGDTTGTNDGSVAVTETIGDGTNGADIGRKFLKVSSVTSLGLALKLLDATGATVGSTVSITDGIVDPDLAPTVGS